MPRSYPPEFRRKVVGLVEAGHPITQIAEMLGVSDQTIYNWRRQHLIDTGRAGYPELLNRRTWRTRIELANAIFEYLEIFHNRQRRHSALGMLSPIEYELRTPTIPSVA